MPSILPAKNNRAFQFKTLVAALSVTLSLTACGGGGRDTVDSVAPAPNLGVIGGGIADSEKINKVNISAIYLKNSSGELTRTISQDGAKASVVVKDMNGKPIEGALVTFNGENVIMDSSNGATITDVDGVATVMLSPKSINETGSFSLSATAKYNGESATAPNYFYSLQATNIDIRDLRAAENKLESGASTILTLKTVDSLTANAQNNVMVNFSATCGSFDTPSKVSANQGDVSVTYNSVNDGKLCEGKQVITASTPNSKSTASVTIDIAAIEATSVVYSSGENIVLGAKSSGSASTGQIEFTVYSNGTPAVNQQVIVDLLRAPADFSFAKLGNRDTRILTSDASGKVKVTLYPGDIPGPVEIKVAVKDNPQIYAVSRNVSVATGRPTQDGITLAFDKMVLSNGAIGSATVTVALTDRQGNYVPAGTVVSFVAEGGTVTPSCSTNDVGQCTVTFTSQKPRPVSGRVTLLAYVEGDKKFFDVDYDNTYTAGVDALFANIGDVYRDDNENNKYDIGEFRFSRALTGKMLACADSTIWQPKIPDTCDDALSSILRAQVVLGFANETPSIYKVDGDISQGYITYEVYGTPYKNLPMPSGTTFSIDVQDKQDAKKDQAQAAKATCEAEIYSGRETAPNVIDLKRYYRDKDDKLINTFEGSQEVKYTIRLANCSQGDRVDFVITTPSGTVTKHHILS